MNNSPSLFDPVTQEVVEIGDVIDFFRGNTWIVIDAAER
jgi:hypothetical protein